MTKAATKILGYYLCAMRGGRLFKVAECVRRSAAVRRYEQAGGLNGRLIIVTRFYACDPAASDHGTVYFMDEAGVMVDVANA